MILSILLAIVGAIILYILGSWWYNTRDHEGSHWSIRLAGFPKVDVPKVTHTHAEAVVIAEMLEATYRRAWEAFAVLYGVDWEPTDEDHQAPIAKIGLNTGEEIEPAHKHIRWILPATVHIRLQSSMYYHFVGELHNMFRWIIHKCDMQIVKHPIPGKDVDRAAQVQIWIKDRYGTA